MVSRVRGCREYGRCGVVYGAVGVHESGEAFGIRALRFYLAAPGGRANGKPAARAAAIAVWPFEADDDYALFEFAVESCVVGHRGADEWPPRYTTWRATPA